jgi:hypothetical protein
MSKKLIATVGLVLGISTCLASVAFAGIVFGPFSTCTAVITQNPARPSCINSFSPDVARLCPSTSTGGTTLFDTVTYTVTLLDALGARVSGATVTVYETSGTLNIVSGSLGVTTAVSDVNGKATVILHTGSGCGTASLCAGGVKLCDASVRSPDNAQGALPGACPLPTTGTSFISANDQTNSACGMLSKFGTVTAGVNDCWDLNCDGFVAATDVLGNLSKGGLLQHFGHGGMLGAKTTCP